MPQNKRESLIYTVLMCFCMVLWMSMYNVTLHMGGFSLEVLKEGWKKFAFTYLVKPEDSVLKKVICVSCSMVVPMVIIMSMYGAVEGCVRSGAWSQLLMIWMTNIPKNFIMALPFQLLVAGPLVRFVFRTAFPEGKVLA